VSGREGEGVEEKEQQMKKNEEKNKYENDEAEEGDWGAGMGERVERKKTEEDNEDEE
jgi:hypothetical protein